MDAHEKKDITQEVTPCVFAEKYNRVTWMGLKKASLFSENSLIWWAINLGRDAMRRILTKNAYKVGVFLKRHANCDT